MSNYVSLICVDQCMLGLVVSDSCFCLFHKSTGVLQHVAKAEGNLGNGPPRKHSAGFL